MNLTQWPVAVAGRVERLDLAPDLRHRFGELGLRVGVTLTITHRGAFGGRVLALGADRFALDAATCARIHVTELAPAS